LLIAGEEFLDLGLHAVALSQVAGDKLGSVAHLESFEVDARRPLGEELGVLRVSVESRGCELLAPPGCGALLERGPRVPREGVVDDGLVVVGLAEGPWLLFVETVIDNGHVGVGRVRVERLTLGVEEDELLISVLGGDDGRGTHSAAFLGHEGLQALEVVVLVELLVVHVVVLVGVVSEGLMETGEGSVQDWLLNLTGNDGHFRQMEAVVDAERAIYSVLLFIVHSVSGYRASHVLGHTVLMDAPEVLDSVADGLLVAVLAENCRSSSEEKDVLKLKLENGYNNNIGLESI